MPSEQAEGVITVWVPGVARPQGSKNGIAIARGSKAKGTRVYTGKVVLLDSAKGLDEWRKAVRDELIPWAPTPPFAGGVMIEIWFVMPRPKYLNGKPTPRATKRPDADKLLRAVMDAVTFAHVWHDDSQATRIVVDKVIAEQGETPGCLITVTPLSDPLTGTDALTTFARALAIAQEDT
jgi:crossover junction endodeoxyribonuclease RusA